MSTIFALATGSAGGAIAILRLSGPGVRDILSKITGGVPPVRRASLRAIRAADGELLDRGVVLYWAAPHSYTGEDCAELQVHGGTAVIEAVAGALRVAGGRPAEPGEFTRRAFLGGRLDLLGAEAVADLAAAETDAQRRMALAQLDGAQSAKVAGWAERLRKILAWQEALIDFPDEDLPPSVDAELRGELASLERDLQAAIQDTMRGARVRDGLVIAITGAPNVGKSSLINLLAQREVAITSPSPGTTRDALEAWVQIGGLGVTLVDTAGLRETDDPVEAEGVRRGMARAASADLILCMEVASMAGPPPGDACTVYVASKVDLAAAPAGWLGVSAVTGVGMSLLRDVLKNEVMRLTRTRAGPPLSRERHLAALHEASSCLGRAREHALVELRGEELRLAMCALGRISGAIGVEDLLDTIFSAFCIGK